MDGFKAKCNVAVKKQKKKKKKQNLPNNPRT